jgi:hypothetical protein
MRKIILALAIGIMALGCEKETYTPQNTGSSSSSSSNSTSGGCICGAPTKTTGAPCQRAVKCGTGYCWQHD